MECRPILRVMEESENGDGVARCIHAIEDDERSPCDPNLVETLFIEVSTRIGMGRKKFGQERVDAGERPFGHLLPEAIDAMLQLVCDVRFDACREDYLHARLNWKRAARRSNASSTSTTSPLSACAIPSSSCARCSGVML